MAGKVKAADVALPIAENFTNSNGACHEFVDKLRVFAVTEYLPATADVENG
jgi:hypothetical protein